MKFVRTVLLLFALAAPLSAQTPLSDAQLRQRVDAALARAGNANDEIDSVIVRLTTLRTELTRRISAAPTTPPVVPPVTPPPPPPPVPSGFTSIVAGDGSDIRLGLPASAFFGAEWLNANRVSVVTDASSPTGRAVQKRFFVGDGSNWNGIAAWDNFGRTYSELLIEWTVLYSPNYQFHASGEKHFYWGNAAGPTSFYVVMKANGAIGIANQAPGAGFVEHVSSYMMPRGRYVRFRLHVTPTTYELSADGVAIMPLRTVTWSTASGFTGVQLFDYWGGAGDTKRVDDFVRVAEFRVGGKP